VLDGEVVALGPDSRPAFDRLQQRMRRRPATLGRRPAETAPVVYLVFDVLWLDGRLVTGLPLVERRGLLERLGWPGMAAGLTAPEVAAALHKTTGAVKALQHRGLASLAVVLGLRGSDWTMPPLGCWPGYGVHSPYATPTPRPVSRKARRAGPTERGDPRTR
jgi:hypothetical protein